MVQQGDRLQTVWVLPYIKCILSISTPVTNCGLFNTAISNLSNDQKVVHN